MNSDRISLFASDASWIEGESLRQLERVASLPGMAKVAGFPDLHPGKGSPVGAAMLSKGEFYPYLVGSDVGCGMGLFATDLSVLKAKPEKCNPEGTLVSNVTYCVEDPISNHWHDWPNIRPVSQCAAYK